MIVLEIALLLVAAWIAIALGSREAEGGPRPTSPGSGMGTAASPSPSAHLRVYDQECDRIYSTLRERVDEVVRP